MTSDSRTAVLAAISGNALLTVLKFGAALVGHSASMMNEAVHSLVDTLNQIFLYLGLHFGSKPPDRQYAFGHGQKKYLWNLWSAIGLFSIGCGLGLAHAWHAWAQLGQKTLPGQLLLPWAWVRRCCLDVSDRARNRIHRRACSASIGMASVHPTSSSRRDTADRSSICFNPMIRPCSPSY